MTATATVRALTTIKKAASTASFTLTQTQDGAYVYTDLAGNKRVTFSEDVKRIYDGIDALV